MTRGARARQRLLLVGMMGSGKTTVGRLLAERLGWRHLDSDAQVESATGRTVRAIFQEDGEPAFRREEKRALEQALSAGVAEVVSVAGGVVLDPGNRDLLRRSGTVVWLRARPSTLARRVVTDPGLGPDHRPLLEGDTAARLAELDAVRRPLYREVAGIVVDVDDLSPDEVAERILTLSGVAGAVLR